MRIAPGPAAAAAASPGAAGASSGAAAASRQAARPPVKRMDAVKQALLLFVHSKLTMCPDHRFAFASLGDTVSLVLPHALSDPPLRLIERFARLSFDDKY